MRARKKAPRKWLCGEIIPNNEAGLIEIATFRGWFFYTNLNKPVHSTAIRNMSLSTIICFLRYGKIHRATINPEWIEFERKKFLALPQGTRLEIANFLEAGVPA